MCGVADMLLTLASRQADRILRLDVCAVAFSYVPRVARMLDRVECNDVCRPN